MRAVLILAVLMAWVYCLAGALGLPVYLTVIAARSARDRRRGVERSPAPPDRALVATLIAYAIVMAAIATVMAALSLGSRPVAEWNREVAVAVAWAGVPAWSALMASVTAVVLRRRRQAAWAVPSNAPAEPLPPPPVRAVGGRRGR